MMPTLILTPAYGRHYASGEEAWLEWLAGRDFKIPRGPYLSVRDINALRASGYSKVRIMFRFPTGKDFVDIPLNLPPDKNPEDLMYVT